MRLVYPGPYQLQLAAPQEGGQRQPRGPEKKVSTIIFASIRFHLLGRAGRPVEGNCEIKVHCNLVHARLQLSQHMHHDGGDGENIRMRMIFILGPSSNQGKHLIFLDGDDDLWNLDIGVRVCDCEWAG